MLRLFYLLAEKGDNGELLTKETAGNRLFDVVSLVNSNEEMVEGRLEVISVEGSACLSIFYICFRGFQSIVYCPLVVELF